MVKINFPYVKFYSECIYRLMEHGVNRYVLLLHFASSRLDGFQVINHKNFPISKHLVFLTRDKHAVLVKSFQCEPTENLLSYKDHLCLFPAFFEDYTEKMSTPATILLCLSILTMIFFHDALQILQFLQPKY